LYDSGRGRLFHPRATTLFKHIVGWQPGLIGKTLMAASESL
jgi:hypothetical protein